MSFQLDNATTWIERLNPFAVQRPDWQQLLKWLLALGACHTAAKIGASWLQVRRMRRVLADVPATKLPTNTFLGFATSILDNRHRFHDFMEDITEGRPMSKMFGLAFEPNMVVVVVKDPDCIKHFLKDNFDGYTKPHQGDNLQLDMVKKWIGDGIFLLQHGPGAQDGGRAWHMQRKISSNIFSRDNFRKNMRNVFVDRGHRMCALLNKRLDKEVDMQQMFFCYTMDSITRIFFGEESDTMSGRACEYGEAFDTAQRAVMDYMRKAEKDLYLMTYLPWPLGAPGLTGLASRLHAKASKDYRTFERACSTLDKKSEEIIRTCRADPNISKRSDLLALFIRAEEREKFTSKYLRDMILNFMIAGRDTTACLLSWAFFELATRPEIQHQLIAEIDGRLPGGREPTWDLLTENSMPYLNGVIYEALRLHPPIPIDIKWAQADDVFPNGQKVPKGAMVWFLPYAMGRDAARYPDPLAFKPERWIPFQTPSPWEFPVFQGGPRLCLGVTMAIFEAKVAMVMLLQKFTFQMNPEEVKKTTYCPNITMSVMNGKDSHHLWMSLHRRGLDDTSVRVGGA
eukprot:CAMPEP_0206539800 /NCGR_PEP_ID=MMETSP0325_2-20121206/8628_1 /ASSEMBLY_ACC=CAM_ASM_000347 /TAXON_ID=2866 /ORGANISM="Crypthecodinium cohnii, Strain Seligo" /LENGTH=568 /DNA_ID=CAMNT_0054037407 /DNA_START=95 /DNA_END=1801 /DNA_ORIENTATION=-